MASDQQVSLARVQRGASTHLNRAARHVIPAFLQKLFEMVNDPANHHLIRWSDAGDSFFVLDHERFAREVLGRWFKHQNFTSFVRQLNMYGFHKIPHLRQGVLRSDSDSEFWNFEHPHFHRGQADMLCLIQRKKQAPQAGDDVPVGIDVRDPTSPQHLLPSSLPPQNPLSTGQILDINSIVNGIAAIKRHQTTISEDLNELKSSNELLWQEALATRERYKKHQDTINLILKFLAGVFGNHAGAVHKGAAMNHGQVVPRTLPRLMIEQGPTRQGKGVGIVEIEDEEMGNRPPSLRLTTDSSNQFSIGETASPTSPVPSLSDTGGTNTSENTPFPAPLPTSTPPFTTTQTSSGNKTSLDSSSNLASQQSSPDPASLTTAPNQDPVMPASLSDMLRSPGSLQHLFALLSSQQPYYIPEPIPPPGVMVDPQQTTSLPPSLSQLTSYEPHFDFSRALHPSASLVTHDQPGLTPPPPSADTVTPYEPLTDHTQRINKTYGDTQEVDSDITSLMETMGRYPNVLDSLANSSMTSPQDSMPADHTSPVDPALTAMDTPDISGAEFDLSAFLNDDSNAYEIDFPNQAESTAFLDEVLSSSDGTSSPVSHRPPSPTTTFPVERTTAPPHNVRKRKSDMAQLDNTKDSSITQTHSGVKAKKKR